MCNLAAIEMDVAGAIVDQDEIVSCAIHFCETQHPVSCSILRRDSQPPLPVASLAFTYSAFIRAIEALRARGELHLDFATLEQLIIRDQHDGEGIWGRWNANGPGTARLFHELGLGQNFDNFDQAKPGDFMKIFWSRQVGKSEHGHSTIFLGRENRFGVEYIRYWSSNIPSGYGEKSVPRSKIAYAIFSRLQTPVNLSRIGSAPFVDSYLASLLRRRSSFAEATQKCGL